MQHRTAALALALTIAGTLAVAAPNAQAASPRAQHFGPAQCQGEGTNPAALVRYRADVLIDAPLRTVWDTQTDVEGWPSWQRPVLSMDRIDDGRSLQPGSQFRWTTPGPATATTAATVMDITSTVRRIDDGHCILWSGPAIGEGVRIDEGVHVWTFTEVPGGVAVHTEETWTGAQAEADVPTATGLLGGGLELWLRDLKATAEARTAGR
ncbi:SRPBCC family protein [Nocardia pseudobrasiliensis]|uniref:Polyketide cyclase/dehydrase/lipid transport protein n=1 Tax=Nocardia pseudobrasiliensis TaxID=45979 RepID=A0A370HXX4_9NOCA|nr:SRPBCC family protein [Nocardia pseudobrasiliensis]RDI63362.1 polyketide cyclase/dehydrase/lipid transport protein [Nocardia pseudobrasiliensis]